MEDILLEVEVLFVMFNYSALCKMSGGSQRFYNVVNRLLNEDKYMSRMEYIGICG